MKCYYSTGIPILIVTSLMLTIMITSIDDEHQFWIQIGSKIIPEYPIKSVQETVYQLCKVVGQAAPIYSKWYRTRRYNLNSSTGLTLATPASLPSALSARTILYYTILYYTILYYTILYYTIIYYTILYYTIITILYFTIRYDTIRYGTILHYTMLYYTIICSTFLPLAAGIGAASPSRHRHRCSIGI